MALAQETPRVLHAGNNTRGPFAISIGGVPITYADHEHIDVWRFAANGVQTKLVEGSDYDLSAPQVLPPVGTVYPQVVSAASLTIKAGKPVLAIGETLLIERNSPISQETVLTHGGDYSSAANERGYDAMVRQIQELATKLNRALMGHPLDAQNSLFLDVPAAQRNGKLLGFGPGGVVTVIDPPAVGSDGEDGATGAQGPPGPTGPPGPSGTGSGDVLGPATHADNEFPIWNGANTRTLKTQTVAQIRALLGLGSAALVSTTTLFQVASNLAEGNAATMRTNLGIGSAALLTSAQVFQVANNLSEGVAATMRANLGLGGGAVLSPGTVAEILNNTAGRLITCDQMWGTGVVVLLTDAATIAVNLSLGINFSVTLAGNRTLANPTNPKVGQSGVIIITQDATGSRTLGFGSNWEFSGATPPVLSLAAGTKDLLHYEVLSATSIFASLSKGVS